MVFTTVVNFVRSRGPDEAWRKRRIFKMAAHFRGRSRNCYSVAVRAVHRALVYATKGRRLRRLDMINLWETRLVAACNEHGLAYNAFREGLARCNIMLNRKVLSELACWEPFTFKSLTDIARNRVEADGLNVISAPDLTKKGIVTKGIIRENYD